MTATASTTSVISPVASGRSKRPSLGLTKSSFYIIGSVGATSGLGFLYWVAAAHILPKSIVGVGASATSAVSLTGLLATLGLGPFLMNRLPKANAGVRARLLTRAALVLTVAGVVGGLLLLPILRSVSSDYLGVTAGVTGFPILILFVVSQTFSVVADAVCIAERRADLMFLRASLFAVLKLLSLPLAKAALLSPAKMVLLSWGFAQLIAVAVEMRCLYRGSHPRFSPALRGPRTRLRPLLRELTAHWFTMLGGQLPQLTLPVVAVARGGSSVGASFYVGWSIGATLFVISFSVSQSLFAEGRHNDTPIRRLLIRGAKLIACLQAPAILVMWFIGPIFLHAFGKSYGGETTTLIRVLAFAAIVDGITNVGVTVARLTNHFGLAAILNVGMAVIAIGTAFYAFPKIGVAAGAWSYLLANGIGSVCVIIAIARLLRKERQAICLPG